MPTKFEADFGDVGHALGTVSGMTATMDTDIFVSDAVKFLGDSAAGHAGREIDSVAYGTSLLNHVYEWNMAGNPAGRLFRFNVVGTGKSRAVQWQLLPSKTPIPTLEERMASGSIANIPEHILEGLNNEKRYVFKTKAQMMEYGASVVIRPKAGGKKIFIPFAKETSYGHTYMFAAQAKVSFKYNRGQFQAAWKLAQLKAAEKATRELEMIVDAETRGIEMRTGKSSRKTLALAFEEGQKFGRGSAQKLEARFKREGLL